MVRDTKYLIYGLSLLSLLSCKVSNKTTAQKEEPVQSKSAKGKEFNERERIELNYLFFNANKEKMLGNNDAAYSLFMQVLAKDPKNDASLYAMAQISSQQKRYDDAINSIRKALAINNKNTWYQSLYGELLMNSKRFGEAVDVYEGLSKNNPERIDYFFEWASALYFSDKPGEAIKVYDKLEEKIGINAEIVLQKEKLYIKLGKIDKAAAELQKLITAFPTDTQYYAMLAELYQANGMSEKALQLYDKILALDPQNSFVHLSLSDYYRSTGNKDKAFEELKLVFQNKNTDLDTKYKILTSYYNLLESNTEIKEQALELNKLLVETHPNEAGAHVFYGEFLFHEKKFGEARYEYQQALKLDNKNFLVWDQLLRTELELKDYAQLQKESEEALALFPTQPLIYYLNGIANLQLKKYKDAVSVLQSGTSVVVDNPALLSDFYANIGDAYFKMKESQQSYKAYEKALELDPKNANTLNNYSYYLSLRGDSLGRAETLSRKSNSLEPNNSYYQDTYGWILYKQKKYSEAKEWVEKAMKGREAESAVILEHYGDILFKLGQIDQAIEFWEKAAKIGGGSESLEKKIRDKKVYE